MDLALRGRTAIVCGASAGIGLGVAESLAAEGANVAMFARSREALEREAERLGALAVRGDVSNLADLQRLVERTVDAFDGIDIVVNNSGGPPRKPGLALDDEDVEEAVELLLLSAMRLTRLCLPYLGKHGRGRVVNITSSTVREPVDNLALSNIVRPGVIGWAKTLARELGPQGVRVNGIAPGLMLRSSGQSEENFEAMHANNPLRRGAEAEDVIGAIKFLIDAETVTGETIVMDSGQRFLSLERDVQFLGNA
jgi:3-oxoacyl-[acyl-carrier protein] reductase